MKHPIPTFDFSHLEEVLHSQFEPELLAETLEQSLYAIIHHGMSTGEKAGIVMHRFDAAFTLMNVFKKMSLVHGDQRNKAAA